MRFPLYMRSFADFTFFCVGLTSNNSWRKQLTDRGSVIALALLRCENLRLAAYTHQC